MISRISIYLLTFWMLELLAFPIQSAPASDEQSLFIEVWQGDHLSFGKLGHPQRWVNVLGRVYPSDKIQSLTYTLNEGEQTSLSFKEDKKRLANDGEFNIDIHRDELLEGTNRVEIIARDVDDRTVRRVVTVNYIDDGRKWPLPYSINWSTVDRIEDVVQVVDGQWTLTDQGVRTVGRYYDRILAFGDDSWRDYEVTASVIFHAVTPPKTDPNTTGVTHVAIATRWPGHDDDENQPRVKWYPLGATAEFRVGGDLQQCRWRIFDGKREFYVESDRRRAIEFEMPYKIKHRVVTWPDGQSRYCVKFWSEDEPEPDDWDLERIEPDDLQSGSALLIAHHTDVTFGNVTAVSLVGESSVK